MADGTVSQLGIFLVRKSMTAAASVKPATQAARMYVGIMECLGTSVSNPHTPYAGNAAHTVCAGDSVLKPQHRHCPAAGYGLTGKSRAREYIQDFMQ